MRATRFKILSVGWRVSPWHERYDMWRVVSYEFVHKMARLHSQLRTQWRET